MEACAIRRVREEFGALSNMSAHAIVCDGLRYPRAEHLFQALRFTTAGRLFVEDCTARPSETK